MDRLGNVEALLEAADLGSFARAARRLRISPSALSRRVAQLERELGVRLLDRTTRAVRLSDEGRAFLERARPAVRELREAHESVAALRRRPAGTLRAEAGTMIGRHVVVPALTRYLARHPDVQVELALRDVPADPLAERIDVSVRIGALADSGLVARRVATSRLVVCGAPAYLRRKGRPRSVDDLERHERLAAAWNDRPMAWRLRQGGAVRELAPGRRVVVNGAEALVELAIAGAGLVWACDFMVARALAAGALVEVLPEAACEELPVHVLTLPGRAALPKVRAFVEAVADELRSARARG